MGREPIPNDLFRAARERLPSPSGAPRPMSRQELADAVNAYLYREHKVKDKLNQDHIGKIERGQTRWPGELRRLGFRAVLGATRDTELGFWFHRTAPPARRDEPRPTGSDPAPTYDGPSWPGISPTGGQSSRRVPEVLVASILRTVPPAHEPASPDVLAARAQQVWRLRQQADYDALGQELPSLIAQAEAGSQALPEAGREQAIRVEVHAYNAASSLLKTVGDCHLGLVAADRAVRHAEKLDDPLLVAAARYRLANVLLSASRYSEATTVALRAADLGGPGAMGTPRSLATWGGLLLTAAVATAKAGKEPEAWQLLGEAQAASRMLAADHADLYCIFGPTNLAIHGVQVATELGNGHDAVRRAQQVDPKQLPPTLIERRGQFLIDLAHAHALLRDDHSAVAVLVQAHQVAPQEVRLSKVVPNVVATIRGRAHAGVSRRLRELVAAACIEDEA